MKKKVVKKTVLKEEELTKIVGGSTARVGFNFLNKKLIEILNLLDINIFYYRFQVAFLTFW